MMSIRPAVSLRNQGRMSVAIAVLFLASVASAQSLSVQVQPSRTRGVAPLAVFFDATGTQPASSSEDAFHDLHYAWSFGDPTSGTWGPSGEPRNEAYGPLAGHVFEDPGSYTVQVRVRDAQGRTASRSVSIVVDRPDSLQTFCFANDNSDWSDPDGACQGAQRVTTANFVSAMSNLAPGRRLLFRRGDVFNASQTVQLGGSGPVLVGAFGSGAAPIVRQSSSGDHFQFGNVQDFRIMDLDLRGATRSLFMEGGTRIQLRQLTLLRITGSGQGNAMTLAANAGVVGPLHQEVAVVDSVFHQFADTGHKGAGVRFDAEKSLFLGNQIIDNENNEHNWRSQHLDKAVIAHNFFDRAANHKENMTIRACNWFKSCGGTGNPGVGTAGTGDTREFIVSDNRFRMRHCCSNLSTKPQNQESFEVVRQGLIERNVFEGAQNGTLQTSIVIHAQDVTVRNNIFDSTLWWADPAHTGVTRKAIQITDRGGVGVPDPANVSVLHNTLYDGSSWPGGVDMVRANKGTGHEIVNNLLYAPNMSNAQVVANSSGVVRQGANLMDGRDYSGSPFVSSAPKIPADYRLRVDSPVRDRGLATDALADFDGNVRASGAPDVGAFEVVTQGGGGAPVAPVLLP